MLNILHLLFRNVGETRRKSEYITVLYIAYQLLLLISTALSPAFVFFIVVSGIEKGLGVHFVTSFFIVLVPVMLYTLVCIKVEKSEIKLNVAFVLSIISALLMTLSLIGMGMCGIMFS